MDARGECDLWLSGNYKLVLKTDADVTVWTVDTIRDVTSNQVLTNMTLAGTLTVSSTAVTWDGNPTHSGNHTWTGNQVFNGNMTVGDSSADTLTIKPNAITWTNNPTHSGAHTWSGIQTFSSNPAGLIVGDRYTPTLTNTTNVAASTSSLFMYQRIGPIVSVEGFVYIDPTAATTLTVLGISLPIASNLNALEQLHGKAIRWDNAATAIMGYIEADTTNDRATLSFYCDATVTNRPWYLDFKYFIV
jgi:hypothetical protein